MVFALSTAHEIGLAVSGAIFITFALLSSFYFPSRNPNFPGRKGLRWYIPLCFVFFIGMLGSVLYFGQEKSRGRGRSDGRDRHRRPRRRRRRRPQREMPPPARPSSRAAGCAACHTFTPAASTGKVGPDLDHLADYAAKAGQPVEEFANDAIEHPPPKYVPPGFPTNAMPTNFGQTLTTKQIDDLVAFITQPVAAAGRPHGAPLRSDCPGEVAEWLKAAPC